MFHRPCLKEEAPASQSAVALSLRMLPAYSALFPIQGELAALHRQHRKGVEVKAGMIGRREVEHAGGADEALEILDGVTHLVPVGRAGLLERFHHDHQRVITVPAKRTDVFLVDRKSTR